MPKPPAKPAKPRARGSRDATAEETVDRFDFQADSLGYAMRRAQMRAYEMFFAVLDDMELSPARVTTLSIIATQPNINQAELGRQLNIAGPSVLKLVDALENAGLICRLDVAEDRRRYSLALTAAGRTKIELLRTRLKVYEDRLAAGLSAQERTQLIGLLDRIGR